MDERPLATPAHDKLLAALSPELRALAWRGQPRRFRKNAVVLREGEMGDSLYVLLQGSVKVFAMDESGREITYGTIHAGDYFGEMSLDGGPRSASVMTLEPCACAVLSNAEVRAHLVRSPGLAFSMLVRMIRRVRATTESARNMALLDVHGRVLALLEGQQGAAPEGAAVVLRNLTHQDIANRVGASREMVSRLLKELEKDGYIELGVKRITLLKKLPARW